MPADQAVPSGGFLAPCRVLDLTDHRGALAGRMFAQLGAEVIQVEPPGGSPARRQPPFAPDWPEGENSLYWAAYAAGKRSIVCDPARPEGLALWRRLVERADFLFESTPPRDGRPDWLDPAALAEANPRLIHVSITPFGLAGPKRDWADSEITLWAAGGPLLATRAPDGSPLRISVPQAYHHAAGDAAGAALIAHFARLTSGLGQHIDVSVQQSVAQATLSAVLAAAVGHADYVPRPPRPGAAPAARTPAVSGSGALTSRSKWPVRDGLAEMYLAMGPIAGVSSNALFAWMREAGALDRKFRDWDWLTLQARIEAGEITEADLDEAREAVAGFLATREKAELMEVAIARGVRVAPVETIADLTTSPHFNARGVFQRIEGPFGAYLTPGDFALGAPDGFRALTPAPRLGEHTDAVVAEILTSPHAGAAASRGPKTAKGPRRPALDGVKVLDLAWVVAGPMIGRSMADYGATVVRIDSSRRVETARLMGPFPGGTPDVRQSTLYENCNAGKFGLTLDLRMAEAREVVRDLAAWADLAVESFTPGQMAKWGLDYASLAARNPGLVMVSTALMGQSGPYAAYSGYGNHGAAVAGFQNIVGPAGGPPVGPFGPYTDYVAPRFGLAAALAALDRRRRTGRGCWLDVSQSEAGMQFLAPQIADYSLTGRIQGCAGNRDEAMAPHGVFAAAGWDSWIAIAVRDDAEWAALARLVGGQALGRDPRFATLKARKANEDALEALIGAWTASRAAAEIEAALQALGVPAHLAASSEDFMADPQLNARGHFVRLAHPLMGEAVIEASRYRLSETPAQYPRAAPVWGRDNHHVLAEILGYDMARITELTAAGVLA